MKLANFRILKLKLIPRYSKWPVGVNTNRQIIRWDLFQNYWKLNGVHTKTNPNQSKHVLGTLSAPNRDQGGSRALTPVRGTRHLEPFWSKLSLQGRFAGFPVDPKWFPKRTFEYRWAPWRSEEYRWEGNETISKTNETSIQQLNFLDGSELCFASYHSLITHFCNIRKVENTCEQEPNKSL